MKPNRWQTSIGKTPSQQRWLRWVNLRPEESGRTLLMFAFYTATSIGVLWLEFSTAALFLGEYGAKSLPWIYVASAGIGTSLGFIFSWLQKILPLRQVIVLIAVLISLPLVLFRIGLDVAIFGGYTVFLMRLWLEAMYVLNELNTSITANQLFNIREIKRTYPIISSGILVADVISGFSLPLLQSVVGLRNVILISCFMLLVGAGILFYISHSYQQAFPDSLKRSLHETQPDFSTRRLRGPLRQYVILTVAFFLLAQVLFLLIDFGYLSQLEQSLGFDVESIAGFLALFSGTLGLFELVTQWLFSSRVIERLGVFIVAMIPPVLIIGMGTLSLTGLVSLLVGLVSLKFVDELLRYTLVAGTGPILFQPIPDPIRGPIQSLVRGIAEPISVGLTGAGMLATIWLCQRIFSNVDAQTANDIQSWIFVLEIVIFALLWLIAVILLRSRYLGLLVMSAERGQLSLSDVDLRTMKRAVVEALDRPGTEADKQSCVELLTYMDPKNVGEVLSPLLPSMSAGLQRQSLEAMLNYPNPAYLTRVRSLVDQPLEPEVLAVALRYIWLTEAEPDIRQLRPYLQPEVDPVVRGTAASLMLQRGNPRQKAEATNTLRRMLTHQRERERVMGCRALGEAVYLQALRLYIRPLLQDESLRVRCALLEAIAATHLEEFYPSLLRGLHYKSTREAAMQALVRLENEALPLLVKLAEDIHKPEIVKTSAWTVIGKIGTLEALELLVQHLKTAWGSTRRSILRILLKLPREKGIDAVSDLMGRSGVEDLIFQEIALMGQIYAASVDLNSEQVTGQEADLLRRSLQNLQEDAVERLFLLMRFLYPSGAIQAAAFNLQSDSRANVARGLEILDNTLDIPPKRILLSILDRRSDLDKLQSVSALIEYKPLIPSERLRYLMDLRHFLSDWTVACCFHLARQARWSLTAEQTLACLRHPVGFVREAALAYLSMASPRALAELLPLLQNDPNPLVSAHVQELMSKMAGDKVSNSTDDSLSTSRQAALNSTPANPLLGQAGLEPT